MTEPILNPATAYPFLESVHDAEKMFLTGRRRRGADLESAVRIFLEFLKGFESLDFEGPCVTVFGSARFAEEHPYYQLSRDLGRRLAEEGYVVMTGGGPGIMEAANRGAKEGGGLSLGCNIELPMEQEPNPYLDRFVEFDHFFVRKVMLLKFSCAFVVMPGGFGTLDEVFETVTLMQTDKIDRFPVIAMGEHYWKSLADFGQTMIEEGTISPEDLELFHRAPTV
ncbi:MAG: LOG family protein, partial [Planctomycetota bacterium]